MFSNQHSVLGRTWMLADDIERYLVGTPMAGLGAVAKQAETKYGIRADYIIAHAVHESDFGRSRISTDKKNLFGWGAADPDPYTGAYTYASFTDCIDKVIGMIKTSYLTVGGSFYNGATLAGMNVKYATDQGWSVKIATHILNMHLKVPFSELYDRIYKAVGTLSDMPNLIYAAVDATRGYLGDYVKQVEVDKLNDQAMLDQITVLQTKITNAIKDLS